MRIAFLLLFIARPWFVVTILWRLFLVVLVLSLVFLLLGYLFIWLSIEALIEIFGGNNNSRNTNTTHGHFLLDIFALWFELIPSFLLGFFKGLFTSLSDTDSGRSATTTRAQHRRAFTRKDCLVCTDTKDIAPMLPCGHDGDICSECVLRHASNCVHSNRTAQVNCLFHDCGAVYTADDIRTYGDDELAREMESVQATQAIEQMSNFRWCYRPGCGSGQVHDDVNGTVVMMTCVKCGAQTCTHHRAEWHAGMTCKQYDRKLKWMRMGGRVRNLVSLNRSRKDGSEVNMKKVMKTMQIKSCPKCGQGVQKNGGCDHVSCFCCNIYLSMRLSSFIYLNQRLDFQCSDQYLRRTYSLMLTISRVGNTL